MLTMYFCTPYPVTNMVQVDGGRWQYVPTGETGWRRWGKAECVDHARCDARRAKKLERSRQRRKLIVLAEPKVPDAPPGQCRWCGERLTGENAGQRRYCYPDREGRDCVGDSNRSRVWSARDAVAHRGDKVCALCGSDSWDWEADHIVALEDGGEHSLENLRRLCRACHRSKTARENAERRGIRLAGVPDDGGSENEANATAS